MADLTAMRDLARQTDRINFRVEGDPPETYEILLNVPGLARSPEGTLAVRRVHRCTVYLHAEYPRRPPVVTWATPIFHPNILPPERNGGVCIGAWSAGESLADLVRRLLDLVAYRKFNAEDPLDRDAAVAIRALGISEGADLRAIVQSEAAVSVSVTGVAVRSTG